MLKYGKNNSNFGFETPAFLKNCNKILKSLEKPWKVNPSFKKLLPGLYQLKQSLNNFSAA
jgi:hypothetical protein